MKESHTRELCLFSNYLTKAPSQSTSHSYEILKLTAKVPNNFFLLIYLWSHNPPVFTSSAASMSKRITSPQAFTTVPCTFKVTHDNPEINDSDSKYLETGVFYTHGFHYIFHCLLKDLSNDISLDRVGVIFFSFPKNTGFFSTVVTNFQKR